MVRASWFIATFCITLFLGFSGLAFFTVPTTGQAICFLGIPVLFSALTSGPIASVIIGIVYGFTTFEQYPPSDLFVHFPPRILMGPVAYFVFQYLRTYKNFGDSKVTIAAFCAIATGSIVNTLGVTGLFIFRGHGQAHELLSTLIVHGVMELLCAVILLVPVAVVGATVPE